MEIDHASPSTALSPSEPAAAATPAALSATTSLDEEAPLVTVTHRCTGAPRESVPQREALSLMTAESSFFADRLTFDAAVNAIHRLWCPALSEQQNQARWGLPGMAVHGHVYHFEIKFKAPVSRKTCARLRFLPFPFALFGHARLTPFFWTCFPGSEPTLVAAK